MADYPRITETIRPTPRNRVSGFLADLLELGAKGYDVGSTLQAGGPITEGRLSTPVSDLLGIPELQRTLNRVSYNEPLTTGTGYTTKLRPDTVSAAMTVAPMVGPTAKAGAAGARMTGTALKDLATSDVAYNAAMNAMRRSGGLAEAISTDEIVKAIQPEKKLTKRQFENQYAQHIDIKGRQNQTQEENAKIIAEQGFSRGFGPNAVPPYAGGRPTNIMSEKFQPQKGDVVYLAPRGAWERTKNGMKIVEGWKPEPHQIVRVEDPNKSMYEIYLEQFNKD